MGTGMVPEYEVLVTITQPVKQGMGVSPKRRVVVSPGTGGNTQLLSGVVLETRLHIRTRLFTR